MTTDINGTALAVFLFFFVLVTVMGFVASRWRKPETLASIDEWGLGGRNFGTWITWFLVGGDFYTAYTVIAVPALVYTVGAYGFSRCHTLSSSIPSSSWLCRCCGNAPRNSAM